MSLLSAAATDEDSDTIHTLRAENEMLRQALRCNNDMMEMTARVRAAHALATGELSDKLARAKALNRFRDFRIKVLKRRLADRQHQRRPRPTPGADDQERLRAAEAKRAKRAAIRARIKS